MKLVKPDLKKFFPSQFLFFNFNFPQIYRKIPALLLWRVLALTLIAILLFLTTDSLSKNLGKLYFQASEKRSERENVEQEVMIWEKIATENPDFRDAYFNLAILSYRLGKDEDVNRYIKKVLELDPNYEPARQFQSMLSPTLTPQQ